jgi:hypothetical protein
VEIWYIFPRVGILYEEKSGNPAGEELAPFFSQCIPQCAPSELAASRPTLKKFQRSPSRLSVDVRRKDIFVPLQFSAGTES